MKRLAMSGLCSILGAVLVVSPASAQQAGSERALVQAVAEAALQAISDEDMIAFTDLMVDDAITVSIAERDGEVRYSVRSRAESRASKPQTDILERGFDPEISISGPVATVWLPYDLYVDGEWSHCGVDTFTLVRTDAGWRIASMAWSVEQPPACQPHPDGPPGN
ncbi:MAG TPA: nuclear transport factor 2 family protein [Acidobacteriota bacterium]|nr:nuclear transport factor 2 family protein [Acidobacteriota bacterium]